MIAQPQRDSATTIDPRTSGTPSGGTPSGGTPSGRGRRSGRGGRIASVLSLAGILALYGWLLAPQLGKPLVYDDVNFALGARAVAETGLPYGNQGYLLHLTDQREQWALWHPPLYIYALGTTMALFGQAETAARGLGVVCQLLTAGLTFDLGRRLVPAAHRTAGTKAAAGVLAVALFLLAPLTVQSALILDIDNTVLMLLLAFYVWVALRLPDHWGPRTILAMSGLYTLVLWAKLTTPILLLAALIFVRLFGHPGVRGALEALAVGALGWTFFLTSWFAITGLTGMSRDYTFVVAYRELLDSQASTRDRFASWDAFVAGAAPALIWIGPFFCMLFLATGLPRLWSLLRGRGLQAGDTVVVLGATVYLLYMMKLAGGFPKYHAAMLPLWAAASGALVARSTRETLGTRWTGRAQITVALIGAALAVGWLAVQAPLEWTIELTPSLVRLLIAVPLLVGTAMLGLWSQLGGVNPMRALPILLAILTLAWAIVVDVHQRGLDGSTTYYYGRHGQIEAARALAERLGPDELYIASKEVAWYSRNQRYVDQESWQEEASKDLDGGFNGAWHGQEIRLLALEVGEPSIRATQERLLLPRYRPIGEYGNFALFERRT